MTKEEANQRAEFLRDKIFRAYNLIQYLGGDPNSVTLPRNGDWINWVANEIYRTSHTDRNMDGAEDFIRALILNQPIWPNSWGQDVSAAAFMLTDCGTRSTAKVIVDSTKEKTDENCNHFAESIRDGAFLIECGFLP